MGRIPAGSRRRVPRRRISCRPVERTGSWRRERRGRVVAGLNYRDKTHSDTSNVNSVPAYVIGNGIFGWESANRRVALDVKNITNERYFIAANGAGGLVGEGSSAFLTLACRQ